MASQVFTIVSVLLAACLAGGFALLNSFLTSQRDQSARLREERKEVFVATHLAIEAKWKRTRQLARIKAEKDPEYLFKGAIDKRRREYEQIREEEAAGQRTLSTLAILAPSEILTLGYAAYESAGTDDSEKRMADALAFITAVRDNLGAQSE